MADEVVYPRDRSFYTSRPSTTRGIKAHRERDGMAACDTGRILLNLDLPWPLQHVPDHMLCRRCFPTPPVPSSETDTLEDRHEQ